MPTDKLIILPCILEFGFRILKDIRYCYKLPNKKLVFIDRGMEALYPNCEYCYDFNQVKDWQRGTGNKYRWLWEKYDTELKFRFSISHPDWKPIRVLEAYHKCGDAVYRNSWTTTNIKFPLKVNNYFSSYDVIISPRYRLIASNRNLNWDSLISNLSGYKIGIAGHPDTSTKYTYTSAWEHPDGTTAGTIDMLGNCKVYIGGDSGVSHLAAFMGIPSIIVHHFGMTGIIRKTNPNTIVVKNMEEAWSALLKLEKNSWKFENIKW